MPDLSVRMRMAGGWENIDLFFLGGFTSHTYKKPTLFKISPVRNRRSRTPFNKWLRNPAVYTCRVLSAHKLERELQRLKNRTSDRSCESLRGPLAHTEVGRQVKKNSYCCMFLTSHLIDLPSMEDSVTAIDLLNREAPAVLPSDTLHTRITRKTPTLFQKATPGSDLYLLLRHGSPNMEQKQRFLAIPGSWH